MSNDDENYWHYYDNDDSNDNEDNDDSGVNGNLRSWWLYDYKKLTMKLMMMVDHIMIGQTNYAAKSEHYEWKQGIVPKIKLNNFHDAQFNYAKEK